MKQRCYLAVIYLNWAIYLAGVIFLALTKRYPLMLVWLIGAPVFQSIYVRTFPRISRYLGYGEVLNETASTILRAPLKVTLYMALGCPFCPIVEERLGELQKTIGFSLEKIDVTLRPDLVASKGIRAVPVVIVGNHRATGNCTTKELIALIQSELSVV